MVGTPWWLDVLWALVVVGYLVATSAHALAFLGQSGHRGARVTTWTVWLGHSLLLFLWSPFAAHPERESLPLAILLFAWLATLNYLLVDLFFGLVAAGPFFLPVVFVATFYAASALPPHVASSGVRWPVSLAFHVLVTLAADASFALGFVLALMHRVQKRQLQGKIFSRPYRQWPSLSELEQGSQWWSALGFVLLTAGLLSGLWVGQRLGLAAWIGDPRAWWTFITWFIYAFYLLVPRQAGRGALRFWLVMIGFASAFLNLTVVGGDWTRSHVF